MKNEILKIIKERENVSFAELSKKINGFDGNSSLVLTDNSMVSLWVNMSEMAINSITQLVNANEIYFIPCKPFTYLLDGICLNMPVVKQAGRKYKKIHWLPVLMVTKEKYELLDL